MRRLVIAILLILAMAGPVYAWDKYEATAYSYTGSRTFTGTWPAAGRTVAVDPKVIPLGATVYINGQGPYRAEDTGGDIRGRRIDIFMSSRGECLRWGRQKVEVFWFSRVEWVNIRPSCNIRYEELFKNESEVK